MASSIELRPLNGSESFRSENIQKSETKTWHKVNNLFFKFRDELWSFIKNSYQVFRRGFKIIAVKIPRFEPKMLKAIAALGLAHAINAALIISKYPSNVKDFLQNLSMKDIEGVVLSGVSLLMNPLDALDSTITFASSASTLGLVPVVAIFSVIALPIAITLLGYASIRGVYDLIRLGIHKHQLPKEVKTKADILKLKIQLEEQLTVTTVEREKIERKYVGDADKIQRKIEVLKSRKISILKRHTDAKIVNVMTNLLDQIKSNPKAIGVVNKTLSDTHTLMNRKIVVGVTGTAANIAMLASIIASVVLPISALVVPIVALVRHSISIAKLIYMEEFYTSGLNHPEMLKQKL